MPLFRKFETPSLWAAATPSRGPDAHGSGMLQADVVIVGGGVAGMSTALHLAEAGVDTLVIDGSSGEAAGRASLSSGGLIAPQLVRGTPESTRQRLGDDVGGRFVAGVAGAGTYTWDIIRRHGLQCDAAAKGFLAPFRSAQRASVEQAARSWQGWRDDVDVLDAQETTALTGCTGYDGALLDRSGGSLDPNAYAWEMGRRAQELGVRVLRGERVVSLARKGQYHILKLSGREVRAGKIILAANGGNMALHPALARTVLPLAVREVATAPLPGEMRTAILPQGHAMTDRGPDIFTLRYDARGRIITAATRPWTPGRQALERAVNARLHRILPDWRTTRLDYAWTGVAWLNADLQPRFVEPEAGILAVQACNGRGIALAGIVGRDAARWATSDAHDLCLPLASPRPVSGYALASRLPNFAMGLAALKSGLAA